MPRDDSSRSRRQQRPISCDFCRLRKLRCSRDGPCSNCVARRVACSLGSHPQASTEEAVLQNSQAGVAQDEILTRLRRLEESVARLQQPPTASISTSPVSTQQSQDTPVPLSLPTERPTVHQDVAWLDHVCTGQKFGARDAGFPQTITFSVAPFKTILKAPKHLLPSPNLEPIRIVWLPEYDEMEIILNKYRSHVSYIHRVVHVPTLQSVMDSVYSRTTSKLSSSPEPGPMVLLLGIIAMVTYTWNDQGHDNALFSLPDEVDEHCTFWIKATEDAIAAAQDRACVSLEVVQAMILISWPICNSQGLSIQYRTLMATALVLSRELGLHRSDHPSYAGRKETIQVEIGRRVWWYLVATDWMIHTRYGGPGEGVYQCHPDHMIVREPRNIDDVELYDGAAMIDNPTFHPTEMSYFLQRLRLAKVSRTILDQSLLANAHTGSDSYSVLLTADAQLNKFASELPPFFNIEGNYPEWTENVQHKPNIVVQAYMIHSLIYIQRCKLHLPYLTRDVANPAHEFSRQKCLDAARSILRIEKQLEKHIHPFVRTRLKFSGILYGLFLSSIVFLIDMCINKATLMSQSQLESRRKEAADAFRILENAKHESQTAAHLLESLMQLLQKHKVSTTEIGVAPVSPANLTIETSDFDDLASGLDWMEPDGIQWENFLGELGSSAF